MSAVTLQSTPLGMRSQAFQSAKLSSPSGVRAPLRLNIRASKPALVVKASQEPKELLKRVASAAAALSIALSPVAGPSLAALDTTTKREGVGAKIEGSDIQNEDQKAVLSKLESKILPEAKNMLGKVGSNEGSNYPSSVAKELETVETEVEGLIRQANEGGDMSNIKSSASGIEQQINALKAIVGFD